MIEVSFVDLWNTSKEFRKIFILNSIWNGANKRDLGWAEVLWEDRCPYIRWTMCDYSGCSKLCVSGEYCTEHQLEINKVYASYKWVDGILYKFVGNKSYKTHNSKGYRQNSQHIWNRNFGKIPGNYKIRYIDNNPFNHHIDNMVVLSNISACAVDNNILSIAEAMDVDDSLPGYLKNWKLHNRQSVWSYNLRDISKASGASFSYVRNDIGSGLLDPYELKSIIEYCQRRSNGRSMKNEDINAR